MGCGFPVEAWEGKQILHVMGGIGSAALKATIEYAFGHRAAYDGVPAPDPMLHSGHDNH